MHKVIVSVALTFALLIGACGTDQPENTRRGSSDPKTKSALSITVGHLPIADCGQLFIGIDKGFFMDEGIDVKPLVLASGVRILEALATKNIDVGFSAVVPLILARSQGLDLVALTGGPAEDSQHPEHALLVRGDSPIREAHQLEGKTIGIVAFRSIDEVFVKEWLAQNGTNVEGEIFGDPLPADGAHASHRRGRCRRGH